MADGSMVQADWRTGELERHSAAVIAVGAVVLAAGCVVATNGPPTPLELHLTEWFNAVPGWVASVLWPVMQFGTLWCPLVIGAVAAVVWGVRRGAIVAVTGIAAWFGAKLMKELVGRGRPLEYLPGIDVREGSGAGLGFPSGHTAVAFAVAAALSPALSRRARLAAFAVAGTVGLARVVYGMHLWVDVFGGAALGVLLAFVVDVVARVARTTGTARASTS